MLCISAIISSLKLVSTITSFGNIFETSSNNVVFNSLIKVVLNYPVEISDEAIP